MYESFAFQHYLCHLQLHTPVRQADDSDFLDDLNALRRGVLSHRLAYSAVINTPDEHAVRLFATKRAVKLYNEHQIACLSGEEHTFATKIQNLTPFSCERGRHNGNANKNNK
uniref:Serine protease gd n=1 Tax=Lygus hesperus TaxID=30085 RepID=A0A0A9Y1Q3_LYGHE